METIPLDIIRTMLSIRYLKNFDRIKFKIAESLECCEDLRIKINLADMHCSRLDSKLNEVKPELIELERENSELTRCV